MNAFNSILAALAFAALSLSSAAFAGKPVNVNAASAAELADALDGIGEAKAQGIGLKTVEKNAAFIKLGAVAAK